MQIYERGLKKLLREIPISEPYISAITKNPCVTVSAPLISEDGLIVGVMGIDIKIG